MRYYVWAACLFAIGCTNEPEYVGDGGLYQVALTASTPAAISAGDTSFFLVEKRVPLQIRKPSQTALQDLRKGADSFKNLPFPRLPWVGRGDLPIEVDFTLSSLDNQEHNVAVVLNGFNEFDEYVPGVQVVDEMLQADYSQWEREYKLEPKQRISRTIREEELDEVAVDLATVVNGDPNPNETVYFENKSGNDPRSDPYMPKVIPGLVGFRIGLRAQQAGKILLEASVRVRDVGDRLTDSMQNTMHIDPQPFTPMTMAAMP